MNTPIKNITDLENHQVIGCSRCEYFEIVYGRYLKCNHKEWEPNNNLFTDLGDEWNNIVPIPRACPLRRTKNE